MDNSDLSLGVNVSDTDKTSKTVGKPPKDPSTQKTGKITKLFGSLQSISFRRPSDKALHRGVSADGLRTPVAQKVVNTSSSKPFDPLEILDSLSVNIDSVWEQLGTEAKNEIKMLEEHKDSRQSMWQHLDTVAVDVIACPKSTRVKVVRGDKEVFWHANMNPNPNDLTLISAQLPATKSAVDIFYLGVWQNAISSVVNLAKPVDIKRQLDKDNISKAFDSRVKEELEKKGGFLSKALVENTLYTGEFSESMLDINLGISEQPNQYWPEKGKSFKTADGILVTNIKAESKAVNMFLTELRLEYAKETRSLFLISYPNWRDFSGTAPAELNELVGMVNAQHKRGAILSHCRAGVGRTGTFNFILQLTHWLQLAKDGKVKPPTCEEIQKTLVTEMRKSRDWQCIQTKEQFKCAIDAAKLFFTLPVDAVKV